MGQHDASWQTCLANMVCQEAHWGKALEKNVKEHQKHYKDIKMLREGKSKALPMYKKCKFRGKQLENN